MRHASCCYSFDDLHSAAFGRPMTEQEKRSLYALPRAQINETVREWVARTEGRFACEDRLGDDGLVYTAFFAVA